MVFDGDGDDGGDGGDGDGDDDAARQTPDYGDVDHGFQWWFVSVFNDNDDYDDSDEGGRQTP